MVSRRRSHTNNIANGSRIRPRVSDIISGTPKSTVRHVKSIPLLTFQPTIWLKSATKIVLSSGTSVPTYTRPKGGVPGELRIYADHTSMTDLFNVSFTVPMNKYIEQGLYRAVGMDKDNTKTASQLGWHHAVITSGTVTLYLPETSGSITDMRVTSCAITLDPDKHTASIKAFATTTNSGHTKLQIHTARQIWKSIASHHDLPKVNFDYTFSKSVKSSLEINDRLDLGTFMWTFPYRIDIFAKYKSRVLQDEIITIPGHTTSHIDVHKLHSKQQRHAAYMPITDDEPASLLLRTKHQQKMQYDHLHRDGTH